nr:hypothetical protein [uncultured Cohaesibacter sp.]
MTTENSLTSPSSKVYSLERIVKLKKSKTGKVEDSGESGSSKPLRPQQVRRSWLKQSFFIIAILPTVVMLMYLFIFASDQYAVESRFAVRGVDSAASSDILGMFTGVSSSGSITTDTYILIDFIHSRQMIDKLQKDINLYDVYKRGDFLSSFSPDQSMEQFLEYWKTVAQIYYNSTSKILTLEIKAFTPEDAKKISELVIKESETLINQLSEQSRNDAVKNAKQETKQMEERLLAARTALRNFRETRQDIDPSKTAESKLILISNLENKMSELNTKRDFLLQSLSENSPSIRVIDSQIASLANQIDAQKSTLGPGENTTNDNNGSFSEKLEDYESLVIEKEFAEKAYLSALTSLERARVEAYRQQRYLTTFIPPSIPEEALYPKRFHVALTTFLVALIVWAVSVLIFYSVRDHIQ